MRGLLKNARNDSNSSIRRGYRSSERQRATETSRSESREAFIPYLNERDHMGKLLATEAVNTPTGEKVSKRIIKKLDWVESTAQVIEYIDMATEPTQAESNAKEMISSNRYVVIDNTSMKSLSNGPVTPSRESQKSLKPYGLNIEKESSTPGQLYTEVTHS